MLVSVFFAIPAYGLTPEPTLEGESAILLDLTTGEILYELNADARQYPASTTKMTTKCTLPGEASSVLRMEKI